MNGKKSTITKFDTGAIRDTSENKESYIETVSALALRRYAKYMTSKQKVYGKGNWKKGIPIESYEESAFRHYIKYIANKYDAAELEPNEDHLAAIIFNIFGIMHEEERQNLPKVESKPDEVAMSLQDYEDNLITKLHGTMRNEDLAKELGISQRSLYRKLGKLGLNGHYKSK